MTAPSFLTWEGDAVDGSTPRRPSTADLGGDNYEDDAEAPPDINEFPSAAAFNQLVRQVAAIAKTTAAAKLENRFSAGAPYLARATGPSSTIKPSVFTVTDMGTGDTKIEWPADTFPPNQCSPTGLTFLSSSTSPITGHVEEITNGVRIRTFQSSVATDIPWTLEIN